MTKKNIDNILLQMLKMNKYWFSKYKIFHVELKVFINFILTKIWKSMQILKEGKFFKRVLSIKNDFLNKEI